MRSLIRVALAATVLSLSAGAFCAAQAQTAERVYENGPVWVVSYIETKPGMFDDYMAYLAGKWRDQNELNKKAGAILDYKVLSVEQPRDGEADVILMVQYKNMAAFDRPLAEAEATSTKVFGSVVKSNQAFADRGKIRDNKGSFSAREMIFKK